MRVRRGSQSRIVIPSYAQIREYIDTGVEFLFRDDFTTPESAPLTSPRTAEPGPGTGTVIDTGDNLDIVSGDLVNSGIAGSNDPRYATGSIARAVGLAMVAKSFNTSNRNAVGFHSTQGDALMIGWLVTSSGVLLRVYDNGTLISFASGNVSADTDYDMASIARSEGGFYAIRGGSEFSDWTLFWVGKLNTTDPLYAVWTATTGTGLLDALRISQLPAPWDTENGIATQVLAGARSASDTFTHEADCLIEFEMTTIPSGSDAEIFFRVQDASNYWMIRLTTSGRLQLHEVVGGTPTQRKGTGSGVLQSGERIVIVVDDEEIKGYHDNTLGWTYSSAANFKTETSGELDTPGGGGGTISEIISWPRTLSGAAKSALDAVAA